MLIQDDGGAQAVALSGATIAEVPVPITGNLDPSSDSGVSNTDHITNVNQPTFTGTSEAGSIVNLFAGNTFGTIFVGTGVADAGGHYAIRSDVVLPDNTYVVYATSSVPGLASDVNGPTILLGTATSPLLVIDTVGPVVSAVSFRRSIGGFAITFQDLNGGLASSIGDYGFSVLSGTTFTPNLVTRVFENGSGLPNDPFETLVLVNHGRTLRSGRYVLTVRSGGLTDTAGNALDGEFYGRTPSGNGLPGGDFQALVIVGRNTIFRPFAGNPTAPPVHNGLASTVAIKAAHGKTIHAPTITPHVARPVTSTKLHDAALAHVTVSKKK